MLRVVTNAVKISKNCLIVMGNKTWCRDWCVAAITSGFATIIPVQTLTIDSGRDSSFDADTALVLSILGPDRCHNTFQRYDRRFAEGASVAS